MILARNTMQTCTLTEHTSIQQELFSLSHLSMQVAQLDQYQTYTGITPMLV